MRHCVVHEGWVLEGDAVPLRLTETGTEVAEWACHPCVRDNGLVPQPSFIGHRDMAPTQVGAA
jgi:hypothetical protein